MYRALLEILVTIIAVAVARSILTSIVRGISSAAKNAAPSSGVPGAQSGEAKNTPFAGTLHKDPVCGTYVTETTEFKRHVGSEFFFYCSESCKAAHLNASAR